MAVFHSTADSAVQPQAAPRAIFLDSPAHFNYLWPCPNCGPFLFCISDINLLGVNHGGSKAKNIQVKKGHAAHAQEGNGAESGALPPMR